MPDQLLEVRTLDAHYGDFQALFGVSMGVNEGEVVAVIGANGAGKSTLLKSIAGAMRSRRDAIVFAGEPIGDLPGARGRRARHRAGAGGAAAVSFAHRRGKPPDRRPARPARDRGISSASTSCSRFSPSARHQIAPSLSGGQQQMVAIARALMSNPKLLLCDEISLGLAPIVIRDIYARIPAIVAEGLSLVIVEQDIVQALKTAKHVYCLQEGRVALEGEAGSLTREKISAAYFGV